MPGSGRIRTEEEQDSADHRRWSWCAALVAAAGVWFFAFRDQNSSTATAGGEVRRRRPSVTALFSTLSNSDPIGLADQLDPAEAALFTDLNTDVITELKRLEVLSPEASADTMTGTRITVKDLTYRR